MQFFPTREIFLQIGSLDIRWYAVLITTGAMLTYFLASREGVKAGYDSEVFDDILIGGLVCGILGARLWFCLFYDFAGYFSNPLSLLEIWDGGLAIQGGLFTGAAFVLCYCKKKNYSFLHLGSIILPYVLIAQAIGRWGNFVNQECYGGIVEEEYFSGILSFLRDDMYILGHYRQPMFFYESVLCIVGFILIKLYMKYSNGLRGKGIYCYLSWYGAIRFWIEGQRTDSLMIGSLRTAQIISIVFIIIGVIGLSGLFDKLEKRAKPVIIFDFDGTLVDTSRAIGDSFTYVFSKYKPELVVTDEDRAAFMGPTLAETFVKYIPERKDEVNDMIEMYRVYNREAQKKTAVAFDGAKEMLTYLKDNGYKIAIASSKNTDNVRFGLTIAGLNEYFDVVIGCEVCQKTKPNKEPIVRAYKALGGSLGNAIYVGDCGSDVKASKNAGVYSIAYCSNMLKEKELQSENPNSLIYDLRDIINIVNKKQNWSADNK